MGLPEAVIEGAKTAAELATITKCDEKLIGMRLLECNYPNTQANNYSPYPTTAMLLRHVFRGGG